MEEFFSHSFLLGCKHQWVIVILWSPEKIWKNLERISKIKHFIDKHNWGGINYPSKKDDWNKFEKNLAIAIDVLYAKNEIHPAYVSKINSNHKKVNLLMIKNGEG